MNLHEYQSKALARTFGLPILRGYLCHTPGEVEAAADSLGVGLCVIKAQVHAGGRGKAGGVKLAKNSAEARAIAEKMLGMKLVTKQTGEKGKLVRKVYVEDACNIDREFYLSLLVDRTNRSIAIIASAEGGTEIEELSHKHPEKIIKASIDPRMGLQPFQCLELLLALGLDLSKQKDFSFLVSGLYQMFMRHDLSLVEVNPLVLTKEGNFVLLDAKCSVDDNAMFRQPELQGCFDYDETDEKEILACKHGLNYIALDGNIGCMVNGAGLAMATMDIIKLYGGRPANFLDVGGGANTDMVKGGFKILLSDPEVKGILVNIFGGIMRCDVIAQGVVQAAQELSLKVPLVVRLQGTNVDEGRKILGESPLKIISANSMDEAAKKIVEAVS